MKATISSTLVVCVLLLALAAEPPRALASENANWGTGVELAAPANAAEDPEARLWHLSCSSAGNCTAVGSYDMPPEHKEEEPREQGELLSETGGRWEPAVEARMPANTGSNPDVERFGGGALSCPSVGNCTAVGQYRDSAGHEQGFLLSETAGTWGTAVEAPLPANVGPAPQVALHLLSCPSAGNCTAVGNFTEPSRNGWQGFLVSETAGTWSAAIVPSLPANASPNQERMEIGGLSCTSVGNCTAIGNYTDRSGDLDGFLWTESAGVWGTAVEETLPANAAPNPLVERYAEGGLSCPSAGNCTAVSDYTDSSGEDEGLILSETSGTWGTGVEATVPAGVRSETNANLHEVQCPSAGNCTAFGVFTNSEEHDREFLTENSGVWGPAIKLALPAGAEPQLVIEGSLSCPSAGDCSYVGEWKPNEFVSRPLLATENDGTWGAGINGTLPANATGDPGAFLSSVSCTSPGRCTAVGSYNSYTTNFVEREGMVFTAKPVTAFLTASGPLGGAFAGSQIAPSSISATLAGGSAPSGTVTFTVFGPQSSPPSSCASGGTTVGTGNAYGDGTYQPSAGFTPPSPGDYWWYASYGGDAGDEPSTSTCGAGMAETTVVPKVAPTLSLSGPLGGVAGSPIAASSISATLAEGSAPTGTVAFTVFGPQSSPPNSCASGGTTVGPASVNGNGTYQPSAGFTPSSPGEYWWYASYGGDTGDEPAASACGALMAQTLVVAAPTTPSSSGSGSSGSGSGGESGTGAKTLAPTLSAVKLHSKSSTGKKGIALKLTLSQPATIKILIAQTVKAHTHGGVCKPTVKKGKSCTAAVEKRTLTFSGAAGSNALELKLAGLGKGSYTATIIVENVNGTSSPVKLTFTIIDK